MDETFETLEAVLIFLGMLITAYIFLPVLYKCLRPSHNLLKRYGANSWVVITGATDGIGKGFCDELARRGFNIALIARNPEKLKKCAEELQKLYPNIQVSTHIFDFVNSHIPKIFDDLVNELSTKDISILVNNIGICEIYEYEQFPEKYLKDEMVVNTYPHVILSKRLLIGMRNRSHRSAIINISSSAGVEHPFPFFTMYCCTKVLIRFFSIAFANEELIHSKIDVMTLNPFTVTTPMTNGSKGLFALTPVQCARGALAKLGYEYDTHGHWLHCFQGWIYTSVPTKLFSILFTKIIRKEFLRIAYQQQQEKYAKSYGAIRMDTFSSVPSEKQEVSMEESRRLP